MSGQIGSITADGEIVLTKKEKAILLAKLNHWNTIGLNHLKTKILKWSLTRQYIHGFDWADQKGQPATSSMRLMGGVGTNVTGNVDNEPYVNNVMMRIHMSNMQRMGRYTPNIDVMPDDNSIENKQGARNGKIFLNDLMEKSKYQQKIKRKLDRIIAIYGSVYLKVIWDPYGSQMKMKPQYDDFGKVSFAPAEDDDDEGCVGLDVVCPKNIVLPPYCVDIDDADWLIENNVRSTEYVLRRYNASVKAEPIAEMEVKWFRLSQAEGRDSKGEDDGKNSLCIVKEAWVERCEEFPLGAHVIWSGKGEDAVIMKSTTKDDFYDGKCYFKSEFIYDDEDVDGETPYWFMIPMQDALNRVESDIRRHEIMMCKPKWQQHTETILQDPDGITNETAQVLKWTGTHVPGIINAPELPKTVFQWRDMVLGEMMSLGAAHDIVRPDQPRSGTAIAYEQEQDDTTLAPTIDSMGAMHEGALSFALKLKSQYGLTEQKHSMRTPRGMIISKSFDGAGLKGNFKVKVNMQSGLPANKIARQQLIVQLVNQQIITAQQAQRYFEFGEVDEALQNQLVFYERAQKLCEFLEAGGMYDQMPAQTFDKHQVMIDEIDVQSAEKYEEWDPSIRIEFQKARMGHMAFLLPPPGMPLPGGGSGAGATQVMTPPGEAPVAPPGMPDSGQGQGQQPSRAGGADQSNLFSIPGMEQPAPAGAPA